MLKVAPLTAVAPPGRLKVPPSILIIPVVSALRLEAERVPPLDESVPELTVIPPLSDKSAAPLIICSVAASSVTACETLSPAIASSSVKANSSSSSVPIDKVSLSLSVVSPDKRSMLVLSGVTPLKSCVPSISRLLPDNVNAFEFVVKVVFLVFSVEEEIVNGLCRTNVDSGSERVEPEARLPPELRVIVPPLELSFARLLMFNAPASDKLPAPVSKVMPDKLSVVLASVKFS